MDFNNLHSLHVACQNGDVQAVIRHLNSDKTLLACEDQFKNWSPVHWAAYGGHLDCLRQVVSFEPLCINIQSSKAFQTPLHCAAEGGHSHCVLWLLQAGVNPGVKDCDGETALHKAARVGSAECVNLLTSTLSNISTINSSGQTASVLAEINGFPRIAHFIRQKEMAEISSIRLGCSGIESFSIASRLNRKRTRDMAEFDNSFKRQRSLDLNDVVVPPLSDSSVMDHEDLCGSEFRYDNYMYESLLRECHGC